MLAAFIPVALGFIYYHPKFVGGAWMKATGITDEKLKSGNMVIIIAASLVLSFLMAATLAMLVTHQTDLHSMFNGIEGYGEEGSAISKLMTEAFEITGDRYISFGHGVVHGSMLGIFLVFPVMAINNMFERRPFRVTVINTIYWIITLALMGGVLCKFGFESFTFASM